MLRGKRIAFAVLAATGALWLAPVAIAQRTAQTEAPPRKPLFGVKAANLEETELEGGHFAYSIPRGTSVSDAAEIISYTDRPINLRVYAADMLVASGGALAPAQQTDEMRMVGRWLRLDNSEQAVVGVPPKGRVTVPFTLSVPDGTASGDYPGAFVVAADLGQNARGLNVETRVALMVRLTVPGKTNLAANVSRPEARATNVGYRFDVDVTNKGNVLFTTVGEVIVRKGGKTVARVSLAPKDIYVIPNGKTTLSGIWADAPEFGRAKVVARIRTFINGEFRKTFSSEPRTVTFVPWRTIGIMLGVIGTLVAAAVMGRGRIRRWRERRRADKEIVRRHRAGVTNGRSDASSVDDIIRTSDRHSVTSPDYWSPHEVPPD